MLEYVNSHSKAELNLYLNLILNHGIAVTQANSKAAHKLGPSHSRTVPRVAIVALVKKTKAESRAAARPAFNIAENQARAINIKVNTDGFVKGPILPLTSVPGDHEMLNT